MNRKHPAVIIIAFIVVFALFYICGRFAIQQISPRPDNLGVNADGQLAACPNTPNCASTYDTRDSRRIEPLPYTTSTTEAHARMKSIIEGLPRHRLITERPDYLHYEFRSLTWGFVDDLEIYLDEDAGLIHMRAAARLGRRDFDVNRDRLQTISAAFSG